jgi:hypothetical protein
MLNHRKMTAAATTTPENHHQQEDMADNPADQRDLHKPPRPTTQREFIYL